MTAMMWKNNIFILPQNQLLNLGNLGMYLTKNMKAEKQSLFSKEEEENGSEHTKFES